MPLNFWRTVDGVEVDFIVGGEVAIEIKSAKKITNKHLKGLKLLQEEHKLKNYYLVSRDPIALKESGILVLPWEDFLKRLWDGEIV